MNEEATYRAVIFGPNPIAAGTEMDLPYVDGKVQEELIMEDTEGDEVVRRRYRRGHPTEEPVPYRFVEEQVDDAGGAAETNVPN